MAYTKTEIKGIAVVAGVGTASGTDTYTVSIPEITAYTFGMRLLIKFTNGNTTSSTINVNSLGVKDILKGVTATLISGDLLQNQTIELAYDGASFQIIGAASATYVNSTGNNLFNFYNFK